MRTLTNVSIGIMLLLLAGMTILSPFVGSIAITLNDGGVMAAAGLWDPPQRGHGPWMHPLIFVVFALLCAFTTKFFRSETWHDLTGRRDDGFSAFPAAMTFMACIATAACMALRYRAWH